jgi:putative RNA 2'-phosphotransferase
MGQLEKQGKFLSWLLRHDLESFNKGLIDAEGWREVKEICKDYNFDINTLDEIVETNNKKRYEYNEDKTKIRARQGHSIPVDITFNEANDITEENRFLYHGTTESFIENIKKEGLIPKSRLYVHLSIDEDTAKTVGRRHLKNVYDKLYIITIDAWKMKQDGNEIYISNNGVYLTKYVDPKYFFKIKHN